MTGINENDYTVPFSLRLTRAQRQRLDAEAGTLTVGEYVRTRLFDTPTPLKRTFRRPVQDEQALSQVLGALGASRLSSNLNQLAKAIHSGALPVSAEAEQEILAACREIAEMRTHLVKALGLENSP